MLIRYLLSFVLIALLVKLVRDLTSRGSAGKRVPGRSKSPGMVPNIRNVNEMMRDPECGIYVSMESPYRAAHEGKIYYFCGRPCMERFKERKGLRA